MTAHCHTSPFGTGRHPNGSTSGVQAMCLGLSLVASACASAPRAQQSSPGLPTAEPCSWEATAVGPSCEVQALLAAEQSSPSALAAVLASGPGGLEGGDAARLVEWLRAPGKGGAGGVLCFSATTEPDARGDSCAEVVPLDLAPVGSFGVESVGLLLAAATGHHAAAFRDRERDAWVYVGAAPWLARWSGAELGATPTLEAALALGAADAAQRAGDAVRALEAFEAFGAAGASEEGAAAPLAARAARGMLRQLTHRDRVEADDIPTVSLTEKAPDGDPPGQLWPGYFWALDEVGVWAWGVMGGLEFASRYPTIEQQTRYLRYVESLAMRLPSRAAGLLRAAHAPLHSPHRWSPCAQPEAETDSVPWQAAPLARWGRDDLALLAALEDVWRTPAPPWEPNDREELLEAVFAPARRWARLHLLAGGLPPGAFAPVGDPRKHPAAGICEAYADAERQALVTERGPDRHILGARRVVMSALRMEGCPASTSLAALVGDAFVAAVADSSDELAIFSFLGSAVERAVGAALAQQWEPLRALRDGLLGRLDASIAQLGTSEREQVLGATLELLGAVLELGQRDPLSRIEPALSRLELLAPRGNRAEAGSLLRLAPSLRLVGAELAVLAHTAQGDWPQATAAAHWAARSLRDDLAPALALAGVPTHVEAYARLIEAAHAGLVYASGDTVGAEEAFGAALGAALEARDDERGAGALVLDTLRLVAAEVAAWLHHADGEAATRDRWLSGAEGVLERLSTRALEHFGWQGSSFELARLAPVLHRVLAVAVTTLDQGDGALAGRVATEAEPLLRRVAAALSGSEGAAAQAGLRRLAMEGLHAASEVGIAALLRGEPRALDLLARRLASSIQHQSQAAAPFVWLAVASLRALAEDPEMGSAFEAAAKGLEVTALAELGPAVRLREAGVHMRRGQTERAESILGQLEAAMAGNERCPVVQLSALPLRAALASRRGDAGSSNALMERYYRAIAAGQGGDALIECTARGQQGHAVVKASVTVQLSGLLYEDGAKPNTLELGVGAESISRADETVVCGLEAAPFGVRAEMVARLVQASWQLSRAEDTSAHESLLRAVALGQSVVAFTLRWRSGGPADAALRRAAEDLPLALLVWVSQLAHARGHFGVARDLVEQATALAQARGEDLASLVSAEGGGAVPRHPLLAPADAQRDVATLVAALVQGGEGAQQAWSDAAAQLERAGGEGFGFELGACTAMMVALTKGDVETARAHARAFTARPGGGLAAVADAWRAAAAAPDAPNPAESMRAPLAAVASRGLYREVTAAAELAVVTLVTAGRSDEALGVIRAALESLPAGTSADFVRGTLALALLERQHPNQPEPDTAALVTMALEALAGRLPPAQEVPLRVWAARIAYQNGDFAAVEAHTDAAARLAAFAGEAAEAALVLRALALAAQSLRGASDSRALKALTEAVGPTQNNELAAFLSAVAASNTGANATKAARTLLSQTLGVGP